MSDYIRSLKQCIKWFQQLEGTYVSELASLKSLLESEEKKCEAKDMLMKSKEEELNEIIMELRKNLAVLQDNLKREESEKMEALNSFNREKEARVAAESLQASLSEELKRTQQDLTVANQKDIQIQFLNDAHRRLQEYNTSLQQYNSNLQSELADKNEKLKLVEKEKAVVVEHLSASRLHCTSLQKELESYRVRASSLLLHFTISLSSKFVYIYEGREHPLSIVNNSEEEVNPWVFSSNKLNLSVGWGESF